MDLKVLLNQIKQESKTVNTDKIRKLLKEEVDKHLPLFLELNNKANDLLNKLKKLGYRATLDEMERGFKFG